MGTTHPREGQGSPGTMLPSYGADKGEQIPETLSLAICVSIADQFCPVCPNRQGLMAKYSSVARQRVLLVGVRALDPGCSITGGH